MKTEIYDKEYYINYPGSDPYRYAEPWLSFFGNIAKRLVEMYNPKTHLDAGCAIGLLVEAMQANGVESAGVDISEYAIGEADKRGISTCHQGSLTDLWKFPRVDLATCIEVVEHIPAELEGEVIRQLTSISDRVVFSSTSGHLEDPTHVNVQSQEHWIEAFEKNGFFLTKDDVSFICPWAKVFEKRRD